VADAKYRVPTMQNRFEKFDTTSYQEIILSLGVFRRETASSFYPWGNVVSPRERAIHFAPRIKTARRFTAKNP
ncbi:MAG: hypothetical protein SPK60_01120, partial [Sodaliphilus sp.]|nr:hypothetical protein [Bacteroidales bacterium]MDY5705505.1 hypothetical protein [Sodaliphilus sp.]